MRINLVGAFKRNFPFGTEIAFKKGFDRLGGHRVTTIDTSYPGQEWDLEADVTVVFKWMEAYWEALDAAKGLKIVYQPDDLRFPHIKQMMEMMRHHCDRAFTFDDDGARLALELGYKKAQKLLLTADDDLYRPIVDAKKEFDVCFVGSLTGGANHRSRKKMLDVLAATGEFTIAHASEIFDVEKIRDIYSRSKIVLNHATDVGQPFGHGFGYQCRHFEAGLVGSCILSNVVDNDDSLRNFETFDSEVKLLDRVRYLLNEPEKAEELGLNLLSEIRRSHLPEHRAKEMLDFIDAA